jgi:hypothetical protein
MTKNILRKLGRRLATYITQPSPGYRPVATTNLTQMAAALRPGDVVLVEGNLRISTAIKYLTQSTWSHSALFVGDALGGVPGDPESPLLVEADLVRGVQAVPLSKYRDFHTRICRPVALDEAGRRRVVEEVVSRLGHTYDLKNLVDLARYLLPMPPVPSRLRRRMIMLGSGEPTKAICSSLIAQAFHSVHYPILPIVTRRHSANAECADYIEEIHEVRHHSLYAPRDFDISPFFQVVKPSVEADFDYRALIWRETAAA